VTDPRIACKQGKAIRKCDNRVGEGTKGRKQIRKKVRPPSTSGGKGGTDNRRLQKVQTRQNEKRKKKRTFQKNKARTTHASTLKKGNCLVGLKLEKYAELGLRQVEKSRVRTKGSLPQNSRGERGGLFGGDLTEYQAGTSKKMRGGKRA